MTHRVMEIEGVGKTFNRKLRKAKIRTTDELLRHCATPSMRKRLAMQTGFSSRTLLKWANFADLMRIKGVGEQYSELLEAAGVDTVVELRQRNPQKLCMAMEMANKKGRRRLVRRTPSAMMIHSWIRHAKRLKRRLKY